MALYPSTRESDLHLGRQRTKINFWLKWKHKGYDWDSLILEGQTLGDLADSSSVDPVVVSEYDVTIIVCMVNAPEGASKNSVFAPGSNQGARLLKLCRQLRAHKRPVCILGGDAVM